MSKFLTIFAIALLLVVASFTQARGLINFNNGVAKLRHTSKSVGIVPPPNIPPAPSNGGGSSGPVSLGLFDQLNFALETKNLAQVLSLCDDNVQVFFPGWGFSPVGKAELSNILTGFFANADGILIQKFVQTVSNYSTSGIWGLSYAVPPKYLNETTPTTFYYDSFRHYTLRTNAAGTKILEFSTYSNPDERMPTNATQTAVTARNFYSAWSDVNTNTVMAFFNPAAEYVEYGEYAQTTPCNFACIQEKFNTAFGEVYNKFLRVRDDSDPIFVAYNKISSARKQFFAATIQDQQYTGLDVASDVFEFDSNFKIIKWVAYYNDAKH